MANRNWAVILSVVVLVCSQAAADSREGGDQIVLRLPERQRIEWTYVKFSMPIPELSVTVDVWAEIDGGSQKFKYIRLRYGSKDVRLTSHDLDRFSKPHLNTMTLFYESGAKNLQGLGLTISFNYGDPAPDQIGKTLDPDALYSGVDIQVRDHKVIDISLN